ncbi:MAG: binding-protein-dependent transport system inner rane component [Paenibacillus sp.]|nr:binding-protein-dependent transport system inner rane component [Paenibacillus sp.]
MEQTVPSSNKTYPVKKLSGQRWRNRWKGIKRNWDLYMLILPVIVFFILFEYVPMYGLQIAFKDFFVTKGIWGSPWIGFEHFERFFESFYFWRILTNTFSIGVFQIAAGFPVPILLALMVHEIGRKSFQKWVQTILYAPHFLSTVIVVGLMMIFLSQENGLINHVLAWLGLEPIAFLTHPGWFKSMYVTSGVWQQMGWNSIIYLAALAGIDPHLHEAAQMDGASRLRRIWHINIPGLRPTIIILLILNMGTVLGVGFEKIYLLQNSLNMQASDVISTHVYRSGILGAEYGFSAAVGLFNSLINFVMLVVVNAIARKVSETSLW